MASDRECPICLHFGQFSNIEYQINPGLEDHDLGIFAKSSIDICGNCGTGQIAPPCTSDDLRSFYELLFSGDNQTTPKVKRGVYVRSAHQFLTFKDLIKLKGSSVIEIGSNVDGWFKLCKMYKAKKYSYFDSVKSKYIDKRRGEYLGFLNKKNVLDIEPESVDLVVTSHSLEHLLPEEVRGLLTGINKLLKKDVGLLFVEIPLEMEYPNPPAKVPPHTLFFTVTGLIGLIESHGFEVIGTHVEKCHKYGYYKNLEESYLKRAFHYVLMKYLLPEKLFPDLIVQLAHGFYPRSEFDFIRVLAKRNK